jgi:3-hydroxybutyryl-CoA dehydrogenase
MDMEIRKVGVVGLGIMGGGIAQVAAESGIKTVGHEISEEYLSKGLGGIEAALKRGVAKGKYDEAHKNAVMKRLKGTTELKELNDCDLVIEAVTENIDLKKDLFKRLDEVCEAKTIFATNTSSFSVAELASCTLRPEKVVGMHFFNPVQIMKLVEVVRSIVTGKEAVTGALEFATAIKKEPVIVKDYHGFVVNILLTPYFVEAIRLWEQGIAGIEDIDKAMKLGAGYPMGPFTLLDMAGLDTMYNAFDNLYRKHRDKKYAPPAILEKMVQLGYLGRKSGKGFYDYSTKPPKPTDLKI